MIGRSPAMQRVAELARAAARSMASVFLHGPSGTGKDLVARAIHELSPRRDRPFLAVNCGGLPRDLIESELFGSVRGAFTGATETRPGIFVAASGGTVFLDEIGEMPLEAQVKLLRVLQTHSVRAVGDVRERPVDIRLMAATNRAPQQCIVQGSLREDLFYRLSVILVEMPPLSQRLEDLGELCEHILDSLRRRYGEGPRRLTTPALAVLGRYRWPGNVRELENVLDCVFALGTARDVIGVEHLPEHLRRQCAPEREAPPSATCRIEKGARTLEECEACLIRCALEQAHGNKSEAARILGISRPNLYFRLGKLGLQGPRPRTD